MSPLAGLWQETEGEQQNASHNNRTLIRDGKMQLYQDYHNSDNGVYFSRFTPDPQPHHTKEMRVIPINCDLRGLE